MVIRGFEAKILKLSEIYQGEIKEISEKQYFSLNGENLANVRVSGIIVDTYKSQGEKQTYHSILLDDGSETINLKHWIRNENDFNPQLSEMMKSINVGEIVDVVGRVRKFKEEFYLVPQSINPDFGIDGEINRRSKILQLQIEKHGVKDNAKKLIMANEQSEEVNDIAGRILGAMDVEMSKNTIENLAKIVGTSEQEIKQGVRGLQIDGVIYNPRPGLYQKTESD